ncbi:MAG: hypothetical protein ACLPY1_21130 [Terracidiphilus sp.]
MAKYLESLNSDDKAGQTAQPKGWFKVGVVAAGSALAGGLLAAWWYRKTLKKFREAEESDQNPYFGIPEDDPADEA